MTGATFFDVIASQLSGKETIVCCGDSLTFGYQNEGAGTSEGETYPNGPYRPRDGVQRGSVLDAGRDHP